MTRPASIVLPSPTSSAIKQVGPGHRQRPHHGVELVVLDLDPGAERRLKHGLVRRCDRAPPHRVQERVQLARIVEAVCRVRQGMLIVGDRAALQLPDDP